MNQSTSVYKALQNFAAAVTAKMTQVTPGQPEDQVRGPFEIFMAAAARALGENVVCTGETPLPDRLGRPDYAVHRNQLLAGYVELKAPGDRRDSHPFQRPKPRSVQPLLCYAQHPLHRRQRVGALPQRRTGRQGGSSGRRCRR